jgi:nitroimidazol reductase NimA-like FMN-containing flavoprotein (pyridoxamine 5'-phosphate oxidase superfamily)
MKATAVEILKRNRIMAVATVRADGWPQTTIVGYASEEILIYFAVSRTGQKFANIKRDNRVSLAIGHDFHDPDSIRGLSMAAHASEVTDSKQREHGFRLLLEQHPALKRLEVPSLTEETVLMRAAPAIITIIDYSKGFGHSDILTVGPGGMVEMTAARDDDWGFGESLKPIV